MDNKNRERKRKELNRQHNMIKKKVIRNKINYDSEEEENEGDVINVSDEDNNVNKKKEKLKKIIKLKDKKKLRKKNKMKKKMKKLKKMKEYQKMKMKKLIIIMII